jgi:hypothetical protein
MPPEPVFRPVLNGDEELDQPGKVDFMVKDVVISTFDPKEHVKVNALHDFCSEHRFPFLGWKRFLRAPEIKLGALHLKRHKFPEAVRIPALEDVFLTARKSPEILER